MKKFLTVTDLLEADWFPIKTRKTIYDLVKCGKLKATNVGAGNKIPKYSFLKTDVINFLVNRED